MQMTELKDIAGGAWKHEAINNIKAYLSDALKDEKNIIIIA